MNEQVKELAEQAGLRFTLLMSNPMVPVVDGKETDLAKFAQLIVQECADLFVDQKYMVLNPHKPFANERVRALKEHDKGAVRKIKQHFGVSDE